MKQGRSHLGSRTRSLRSLVADSIGTDIGEKVHSALASRLGRALRFDLLVCRMGHATLEGTRLMNRCRMNRYWTLGCLLVGLWQSASCGLIAQDSATIPGSTPEARTDTKPSVLVVIGAPGEEGYSTIFRDWANRLHGLCQNTIGL